MMNEKNYERHLFKSHICVRINLNINKNNANNKINVSNYMLLIKLHTSSFLHEKIVRIKL